MPDTLESIKKLYDNASADERMTYLFEGMIKLNDNMKIGFLSVDTSIKNMQKVCVERKIECNKEFDIKICGKDFVTRKQAKIAGIIILALATGMGIGAGWITFAEAFRYAIPIVP